MGFAAENDASDWKGQVMALLAGWGGDIRFVREVEYSWLVAKHVTAVVSGKACWPAAGPRPNRCHMLWYTRERLVLH